MSLLFNGAMDLMTKNMGKKQTEDSIPVLLVSTGEVCHQASQVSEPSSTICRTEASPTAKQKEITGHLKKFNVHGTRQDASKDAE